MEMSAQASAMMGATRKSGRSTSEGHQVFLEEELDAVGEGLEEAEGADAEGPQRFCMRPRTLRSSSTV